MLLANPPSHCFMKCMFDFRTERALHRQDKDSYSLFSFVMKECDVFASTFVRYFPFSSLTWSHVGKGMEAKDEKSTGVDLQ